ncbi:MAG: AMP-binding protein, partial [Myxococcales bacterium]|nr:AMP-binding protein [Myxococcales bacterium]
ALTPDAEALRFDERPCSFRELADEIAAAARALRAMGVVAGDKVVIVSPNCREFFALYYGVLHLRAAAVPVFHGSGGERIAAIARHCDARLIVATAPLEPARRDELQAALPGATLVQGAGVLAERGLDDERPLPRPHAEDLAMLQYTSGTTGDAKGVMLTHQALVANIRQMIPSTQFHQGDVFVSWLPVYHDMGLITMTMCPLYLGARLVLLPVSLRPRAWLEAITRHRGTMTAAPDFAYRYALRFAGDAARYDLSSLRFALVAAEPVRASTVRAFEEVHGLRDILRPGYGLAEACVGVALWPFEEQGLAVDERGVVAVGRPLPDIEIDIRDDDRSLPPGECGEICFRSPSQTLGYFRDPERTAAAHTPDGFLRTGDRGYLDERGVLFVVGRIKELIIVAGRNVSPRELEEVAERCEGVAGAMALGVDGGGDVGEQIHLFVEVRAASGRDEAIARDVRERVHEQLGLRPERVHVVRRGAIPRTYNGKLQYQRMRAQLAEERITIH